MAFCRLFLLPYRPSKYYPLASHIRKNRHNFKIEETQGIFWHLLGIIIGSLKNISYPRFSLKSQLSTFSRSHFVLLANKFPRISTRFLNGLSKDSISSFNIQYCFSEKRSLCWMIYFSEMLQKGNRTFAF